MNFAELIRAARRDHKLSQKAVADQISTASRPKGLWPTYIGQIEKGQKVPSDDVCVELARILDLERDVVLLLAYQARTESDEARALFERILTTHSDPLAVISEDPELHSLVQECRPWLQALAQIRRTNKGREKDIQALLSDLTSLDQEQWDAAKILFARFREPFEKP